MNKLRENLATIVTGAIVVMGFVVLTAWLWRSTPGTRNGRVALVHDGDGIVHELPLDTDVRLEVTTTFGTNVIVVEDGAVRMAEADCPHGTCLQQAPLSAPGRQIVCLPHELWIEVVDQDNATGSDVPDVDLVAQ